MLLASIKNAVSVRVSRESPIWTVLRSFSRRLPKSLQSALTIRNVLEQFCKKTSDVFFVQVGSFNGVDNDPLHDFIIRKQWAGLLIEPDRDSFLNLQENYRGNDKLLFENVAVAETIGPRPFWRLKKSADSPAWHSQLSSLRADVILSHANLIPEINELLFCEEIFCTTISALIQKHAIRKVDLLHLDTEGYDYRLLKSFDFDVFRPTIVLFEHTHLSEDERQACSRLLRGRGYKLIEQGTDSLAFL